MRRWVSAITIAGLLASGIVCAAPAGAASSSNTLHAKHALHHGQRLVSANGRYHVAVEGDGRVVVRTRTGHRVWSTPKTGARAVLYLGKWGQLIAGPPKHARWTARTYGSGRSDVLTMRNDGVLALTAGGLLVWSSAIGNGCPHSTGKRFIVDLSKQFARACKSGQQLRATPVTTGAVDLGNGTPRGTWHVQARVRNTTLYPAAGGAYPVKYWVPYDGVYGIHDSSWQHFAYGSQKYRTHGSHGCIHVPARMMTWFFGWAAVGTTVTIHS